MFQAPLAWVRRALLPLRRLPSALALAACCLACGVVRADEPALNDLPPLQWLLAGGAALLSGGLVAALWWCCRVTSRRTRQQLEARLLERERMARQLHDTLLQGTQGLVLNLQVVAGELPRDDPRRQRLEALLDDADAVIAGARERVHEMADLPAGQPDLLAALAAFGREQAQRSAARFALRGASRLPPLEEPLCSEAFLILREALANAFQHAKAQHVELEARVDGPRVSLFVRDDGLGIDARVLARLPRLEGLPGHAGLRAMHQRAERLGSTLALHRRRRGGTELRLFFQTRSRFAGRLCPTLQALGRALRRSPPRGDPAEKDTHR